MRKLTKEEFIKESTKIHNNIYDYSLVEYINNKTKVKIICPKHGLFNQLPMSHLKGIICFKCGVNLRSKNMVKTNEKCIKDFINVHGNKYDYSLVEYKKSKSKVKIICKQHGIFEQTPSMHLSGEGCKKCGRKNISEYQKKNPTGWNITNWNKNSEKSKNFDSFKVYIIKCWNDTEQFYKIGRTYRKTKDRLAGKHMPYNYEIIEEIIFNNARDCYDKENELKKLHKKYRYVPFVFFHGKHECFSKIII